MAKRILGFVLALGIVGGALAGSKKSDPDTLARVGEVVGQRVKASLPEASKVAGPLTAFKPGDALPVEEKVRMRIHTDKKMAGTDVTVAPGSAAGEVKLRGLVKDRGQWTARRRVGRARPPASRRWSTRSPCPSKANGRRQPAGRPPRQDYHARTTPADHNRGRRRVILGLTSRLTPAVRLVHVVVAAAAGRLLLRPWASRPPARRWSAAASRRWPRSAGPSGPPWSGR